MNLHLAEIATAVAPGAHAAVLLDQAGWHLSDRLTVPPNITLVPLPPRCPELNSAENVWQFMRDNWLSNRVFGSYDAIVEPCCEALLHGSGRWRCRSGRGRRIASSLIPGCPPCHSS
jgi:transposase